MKITYLDEEQKVLDFVRAAAEHFEKHPKHYSFTTGEIEPGCLLALRWGLGEDCVLIFRLDEYFQPIIFQQAINREEKDADSGEIPGDGIGD